MTSVSTHVLDVAGGRPAAGVVVSLESMVDGEWHRVGEAVTDGDGRVAALATGLPSGTYRLVFGTGAYGNPMYPRVDLVVALDGSESHYHLPLLLSPYGYSTYRGS